MKSDDFRTYQIADSIVFQKNNEDYGQLSNMATQFPVVVNDLLFRTNEALYQSCRFPEFSAFQQEIIDQKSPMAVKYISRKHRSYTRSDWELVKVNVMRWCLKVKLAYHQETFGEILLSTGDKPIVERSRIDQFWGAKSSDKITLIGGNVLGRLLMELREQYIIGKRESFLSVEPLTIDNFLLLGEKIKSVNVHIDLTEKPEKSERDNLRSYPDQLQLPF